MAGENFEFVPKLRSCYNRLHWSQHPVQLQGVAGLLIIIIIIIIIVMGPSTTDIITSFENDQKNTVFSALRCLLS